MAPKKLNAREWEDLIQLKPLERLNLVLEVDRDGAGFDAFKKVFEKRNFSCLRLN